MVGAGLVAAFAAHDEKTYKTMLLGSQINNNMLLEKNISAIEKQNSSIHQYASNVNNIIHSQNKSIHELEKSFSNGLKTLGAAFNYSMGQAISLLNFQINQQRDVLSKLESIVSLLENPSTVKSFEQIKKGYKMLNIGLLDKAIECFEKAIEFDSTSLLAHIEAGKIYLSGLDDEYDLINIEKAYKYLEFSSKYLLSSIEVEKSSLYFSKHKDGEISDKVTFSNYKINIIDDYEEVDISLDYIIQTILYAVSSIYINYKTTKKEKLLDTGLSLIEQGLKFDNSYYELRYLQQKFSYLKKQDKDIINSISEIIDIDYMYFYKFIKDEDFAFIHDDIKKLQDKKLKLCKSKINKEFPGIMQEAELKFEKFNNIKKDLINKNIKLSKEILDRYSLILNKLEIPRNDITKILKHGFPIENSNYKLKEKAIDFVYNFIKEFYWNKKNINYLFDIKFISNTPFINDEYGAYSINPEIEDFILSIDNKMKNLREFNRNIYNPLLYLTYNKKEILTCKKYFNLVLYLCNDLNFFICCYKAEFEKYKKDIEYGFENFIPVNEFNKIYNEFIKIWNNNKVKINNIEKHSSFDNNFFPSYIRL